MRTVLALAFVVAAACGGSQKDVAVRGKDQELAKIAGDWAGEYVGRDSGRKGPVSFSLQLGRHVAEGEVVMGGQTPLEVQFVEIEGGQLSGQIAPYTDPSCACQAETSFIGRLDGANAISGTFETKVQGQVQTGTWSVKKQ